MRYSTLNEENKLWKRGLEIVVGIDEAGRGPLAGPVIASAVSIAFQAKPKLVLKDSKQLSAIQREKFYTILTSHEHIRWGIGIVSEKIIDKINIFQATKLAMKKAVENLAEKLKGEKLDMLLIDGISKIESSLPQRTIIKGDELVFSCSAASIIAKVTRDRIMKRYHAKYPLYGFDTHKGYGTKLHFKMLRKYGPCKIHRKSFYPLNLTNKYF